MLFYNLQQGINTEMV